MKKTLITMTCLLASAGLSHAQSDLGWSTFDENKDNALSIVEFGNYRSFQYVELDLNLDGIWSRSEFVKRPNSMKYMKANDLRAKFKRWDKNKDGVWSAAEAERAIKGNFRWLDKDKNKLITVTEMPRKF